MAARQVPNHQSNKYGGVMNIAIVGTGYVGLVTGACFAELGNNVVCVDNNKEKIKQLKKNIMPIYEHGLGEMVLRNVQAKRLSFTHSIKDGMRKAEVVFIAVGTPPKVNSEADLTSIEKVALDIASGLNSYKVIVEKSTVPVETGEWIKHTIQSNKKNKVKFDVASNPEFLREGSAIKDFMHPDRVVVGVELKKAKDILTHLYSPLKAPIVITDIKSAEIIKHASNSFLATKISFINAISQICDCVGADVVKVAEGMGLDKRIERGFLDAGIGYGGSCFPKDIDAFIKISEKHGYDFRLLREVRRINEDQKKMFVSLIEKKLWILKDKVIGILGLSFKPGTDDMRNSPSIDIINTLQEEGAKIKVFDPQAMPKAKEVLSDVKFCKDPYDVARGSDCLVLVTEWNQFKELDFKQLRKLLRHPVIFDGRNIYDEKMMKKLGFKYYTIGRGKS